MKTLTNISRSLRLAAVLATGAALIAATDAADARGMGGNASHGQRMFSTLPETHGNGYKSSGHLGKEHEGKRREGKNHEGKNHEGKEHDGRDHNATRQSKNGGCNRRCQSSKDTIVVTNSAGKVLYRLPKSQGEQRETAQAIPGGFLVTIGDRSFKIAGNSVTIKNFALSTSVADKAGLTQTIKRNKDGTISDVITKKQLIGL
jgi:hypothetical protein